MFSKFRNDEGGFTLIELLVVILIIGILAAIALPTFLGQQKKGQDSEAKSNARNLVSHVESCFADTQDYTGCDSAAELPNTGLDYGAGAGQVTVASGATTSSYTVTATSKAKNSSNVNHTFSIARSSAGVITRSCTPSGEGGCKAGGSW